MSSNMDKDNKDIEILEDMKEEKKSSREDLAKWYVIHTYSGHESKVKHNMEAIVQNRHMEDLIFDIKVPMEEYLDQKDGQRLVKERKMFPSYVLVKMIMNDESWYLVRNTRGVTGFVGPGSKPVPLTDEEVMNLGVFEDEDIFKGYEIGDAVKVINGPFNDFVGRIESFNYERKQVKVFISMFGRDTLVELNSNQIIKA